ncbi:hypothetical protein [Nocardioides sp. B-3]|uniref:hypothetical protein n=1 Tax=Nocardioides sp. B-3 TaxID=2895565 RepID=UPI00215264F3|nr:hypothetical protein [Nocardioides sp. B-3]UUZ57705.1 hypothetical protein LP418_14805 [Nocardioides sp. B-3]
MPPARAGAEGEGYDEEQRAGHAEPRRAGVEQTAADRLAIDVVALVAHAVD